MSIDSGVKMQWQMAARYSARVSFVFLFAAQILSFLIGFYKNQKVFNLAVFGFVINHIIHLFFLMYVMYLSDWAFSWVRHILAGTAYIVLLFWIVRFFQAKENSITLDWFSWILCFQSGIIFIITYVGRYQNELMPFANKGTYLMLLILSIVGFVALLLSAMKYKNRLRPS